MRLLLLLLCPCFLAAQAVRPVAFIGPSGDSLRGELRLPAGGGPFPAIVFLVGSGRPSSPFTGYTTFLDQNLEPLRERGFALLYFDKRGVGRSEGKWFRADFHDRAADAHAAVRYLHTLPDIDTTRIGLVGHSQGGWIAQLAGAEYPDDVAFIVSLAGPTFGVRCQLVNDFMSDLQCKGITEAKAYRRAVRKARLVFTAAAVLPLGQNLRQLRRIRRYEAADALRGLRCPTLLLFGENDCLVYPAWAEQALADVFPQGAPPNIELHTIPGAQHDFKLGSRCESGREEYASAFQRVLWAWIAEGMEE